jgi:hypothetical protein
LHLRACPMNNPQRFLSRHFLFGRPSLCLCISFLITIPLTQFPVLLPLVLSNTMPLSNLPQLDNTRDFRASSPSSPPLPSTPEDHRNLHRESSSSGLPEIPAGLSQLPGPVGGAGQERQQQQQQGYSQQEEGKMQVDHESMTTSQNHHQQPPFVLGSFNYSFLSSPFVDDDDNDDSDNDFQTSAVSKSSQQAPSSQVYIQTPYSTGQDRSDGAASIGGGSKTKTGSFHLDSFNYAFSPKPVWEEDEEEGERA